MRQFVYAILVLNLSLVTMFPKTLRPIQRSYNDIMGCLSGENFVQSQATFHENLFPLASKSCHYLLMFFIFGRQVASFYNDY